MTRQELLESNEFWDEKLTAYKRNALSKKLIVKDIVKHVREAFAITAVKQAKPEKVCGHQKTFRVIGGDGYLCPDCGKQFKL